MLHSKHRKFSQINGRCQANCVCRFILLVNYMNLVYNPKSYLDHNVMKTRYIYWKSTFKFTTVNPILIFDVKITSHIPNAVSYTHLDVYKRQVLLSAKNC